MRTDRETWVQAEEVAPRALRDTLSEEPGATEEVMGWTAAGVADEVVSGFDVRDRGTRPSRRGGW